MDSLPAELLAHVFSFLPPEDVARGKQLNKHTLNSLTLYRRRLPRPDAGIVRISVEKTDNEDDVSVKINVNYRFADPMNLIESFHCKRSELLVSKKSPALYSHFKELEGKILKELSTTIDLQDCGDYVRQEVGSLAESLDIALQWITREMFLGELQIDCCEEGSLTPELMDVLVKVGRKVSEEQTYAKLSLYLNEDLLHKPMWTSSTISKTGKFASMPQATLSPSCPKSLSLSFTSKDGNFAACFAQWNT